MKSKTGVDLQLHYFLLIVLLFFTVAVSAKVPPNIVFILTDNQSADALSVYGNRDVDMPHIEALAARGVLYNNAFAASGVCSSTRATLMTGLMPSQHGLHNALHDGWVDSLAPGWSAVQEFRTVSATLKQNGYQTAMIGKWHIGDPKNSQLGFDHWVALPYGHTVDFWNNQLIENGEMVDVEDIHIVDKLAAKAVSYLADVDENKPFYLQLSLDGPYALPPTNYGPARNRHYQKYIDREKQSMPLEAISDEVISQFTGPFVSSHALENGIDSMDLDEIWNSVLYRTVRMQGDPASYANFLSQNSVVDDAVGRVWQALVERGLQKNTIVVFSSDQGNLFGQHGTWGHTIWFAPSHLYDVAMRIPLIVYHPNATARGAVSDQLIAQYDFAPTLLAFAGIEKVLLEDSPGKRFYSGALGNLDVVDEHHAVFFEQEESRGIRTLKYAYWKRAKGMGEPVLYDIEKDPGQRNDIYNSLADSDVVKKLDSELDVFFSRYSFEPYNLWEGGVAKGTTPKLLTWLKAYPWPWIKKIWRDNIIEKPVIKAPYEYE